MRKRCRKETEWRKKTDFFHIYKKIFKVIVVDGDVGVGGNTDGDGVVAVVVVVVVVVAVAVAAAVNLQRCVCVQ